MAEVSNPVGCRCRVIIVDEEEADALARLLELEVINEGHEPLLQELAEALA